MLLAGRSGLKDQAAGFGVNGDAGKAGENSVAEKPSFALEDRFFVKTGWNILEFLATELDGGLSLRNGQFRQADGSLGHAVLSADL